MSDYDFPADEPTGKSKLEEFLRPDVVAKMSGDYDRAANKHFVLGQHDECPVLLTIFLLFEKPPGALRDYYIGAYAKKEDAEREKQKRSGICYIVESEITG